ncbi:MAG: NUDIX hydrolase [Pseudomonadota bacterium]
MTAFNGAKALLTCGSRCVVLRRDDIPTIQFPGMIDLPGGGREAEETPEETILREVREETGLALEAHRLSWCREYLRGPLRQWMFRADITPAEAASLRLGDEGQALWLMEVADFLAAEDAIAHMKDRARDALGRRA